MDWFGTIRLLSKTLVVATILLFSLPAARPTNIAAIRVERGC